jgi:predicted alpha/beta superfamily hydrolase
VVPRVASTFGARVRLDREHLGMLGSSLGGLISCYAGWTRSEKISKAGCMSSSFWWNDEDFVGTILPSRAGPSAPGVMSFYMDSGNSGDASGGCGSPDADDCDETLAVMAKLEQDGWTVGTNLFYYLDVGGKHSESYWGNRFWKPMQSLYPPEPLVVVAANDK